MNRKHTTKKALPLAAGIILLTTLQVSAQQPDTSRSGKPGGHESTNGLKISGYVQVQGQHGGPDASLNVGTPNPDLDKGYDRIGIRRGRIKLSYEKGMATGVFQVDMTEKGIALKDAYLNLAVPRMESITLTAGVFNRPFGYEIERSSSLREEPERSTIIRTLFPDERDLGAMLILQAPESSPWHIITLNAGWFAGNGIKPDIKSKKDFIGHLSVNKALSKKMNAGGGVSYYHGSVYQGTSDVYTFRENAFVLNSDTANKGTYAKREYVGIDAQLSIKSTIGRSQISGEFLVGTQPGNSSGSKSPNSASLGDADTYIRNFRGGYATLVQSLGKLPVSVVIKYDWYNPNVQVSKDEIGRNGTGEGDISYQTTGAGLLWQINTSLRVTAYYDIRRNELSQNLAGFHSDLKDNVFTFRLQYKF